MSTPTPLPVVTWPALDAAAPAPIGRLVFGLAAALILILAGAIVVGLAALRAEAIATGTRLAESFARVIAEQTTRTLQTADLHMELAALGIARLEAAGTLNEQSARALLREHAMALPFVRAMWVMNAQGRIIYDSDVGNVGVSLADRPYFRIYVTQPQTGFHVDAPVRSRSTDRWLITATRPLRSSDDALAGIIVVAMEPPFFDSLWSTLDVGADGAVALLRRDGVLMMRSPIVDDFMGRDLSATPMFTGVLPHSPAGTYDRESAVDGKRRLYAYRTLSAPSDLVIVVGRSYDLVLAPWHRLAMEALAFWAAATLAIIVLGWLLERAWRQRARADAAGRDMAQRFILATDAASIGVWDWDLTADRWCASPTYFTMLGYDPAEGFGDRAQWLARVHPQDRASVEARIQSAPAGAAAPYQYEARMRHADGSYRWIAVVGRVLARGEDGKATRLIGVRIDVTEGKLREEALREAKEKLHLFIDHAPSAIAMFDRDMRYIAYSRRWLEDYDLGESNLAGRSHYDIFPDVPERWKKIHRRCLAGAIERADEDPFPRADGSVDWVRWEIRPWAQADGSIGGIVMFTEVITARVRAEGDIRRLHDELRLRAAELEQRVAERTSQLEVAKLLAEGADQVKSVFLATMSHELRTPLNSIIGFTGILLQRLPGELNAEQEKQLCIVRDASRHLLALISDALDISKVEAGELHVARDRFDLSALLERLGSAFAPQAERRRLAFTLDAGDGESMAMGDARRVEQVLNNLVSNALKFTPRGGISLSCVRKGDFFVITVADTGVGIRREDMDRLFRPFSQIENGLSGISQGTGLGLAISLRLVQALGGRLTAESEWGKGSRFTFTLPAGATP